MSQSRHQAHSNHHVHEKRLGACQHTWRPKEQHPELHPSPESPSVLVWSRPAFSSSLSLPRSPGNKGALRDPQGSWQEDTSLRYCTSSVWPCVPNLQPDPTSQTGFQCSEGTQAAGHCCVNKDYGKICGSQKCTSYTRHSPKHILSYVSLVTRVLGPTLVLRLQ